MSTPLELAAAHLKTAKDHLDLVKAQYQSAKATYESSRTLYEALESSELTRALSETQNTELCDSCRAIPVTNVFKQQPLSKPRRQKVGDLLHAVQNQASCTFCRFLVESFRIGSEDGSEGLHPQSTPPNTAIYFASDLDGKAWYTKAGIDTDLPPCPFVWLQTGPRTLTGQPHICVSFEPTFDHGKNAGMSNGYVYPRQRGVLESTTGCTDYGLVKSWLGKCCADHGLECQMGDTVSTLPLNIYLIDVQTRRFVQRCTGERYVALSYVWGTGSQRALSVCVSHIDTFGDTEGHSQAQVEFIQDIPTVLPQTMMDAMTFVKGIGERYLWVDQLCINQANKAEKQRQVNSMDRIFASAYLTIVSLDGQDADWGLSGISRPLQQVQQPTLRLGSTGRLMATFIYSNWDNNGSSTWDSRGWTLQERLLSQRCIMFSRTHISMICRREFFHDCLAIDPAIKSVSTWLGQDYFREDGSGINLDDTKWDFKNYDALISVFSGRKLTYEADALNACRGSLNRISQRTGMEFAFGLPVQDCLRALIWVPHPAHSLARRHGFPSWSWTGWTGRIEYAYWVSDMADYLNGDTTQRTHEHRPPSKRKRTHLPETRKTHPERASVRSHPTNESDIPILRIETTVAKFKVHLVRRDREPHRNLKPSSPQSKNAIGDHWTLKAHDGRPLRDMAGEHPSFEPSDYLFRLKPEYSQVLLSQDSEADLMFVEHWPVLRDSAASNRWLHDMVSALLVVRNPDNSAWRLAPVLIKGEEWYAKNPSPEVISLI